jgi:hypothetical protein
VTAAARPTPYLGIDLVEGAVCLWAGGEGGEPLVMRPDVRYPSPGVGRVVVAAAFARSAAAGRVDLAERTVLTRGRDMGDRGVLPSLGPGLNPTWRDLLVIALTLEDREATGRLGERLGAAALTHAAHALGLPEEALVTYPTAPPVVSAREAAGAMLRLEEAAGAEGFAMILPLLLGVRYRWRVRTRLDEGWEVATAGSRQRSVVEEVALWRTAAGWASAAIALTDVDDAWRAEYVMGDAFRRLVEEVGVPVKGAKGGDGR